MYRRRSGKLGLNSFECLAPCVLPQYVMINGALERYRTSTITRDGVIMPSIDQTLVDNGGPWLVGEAHSLADITLACMLLRLEETGWLEQFIKQPDLQSLIDYCARIKNRKSWYQAIVSQGHPIIERATKDLRQARAADPEMFYIQIDAGRR